MDFKGGRYYLRNFSAVNSYILYECSNRRKFKCIGRIKFPCSIKDGKQVTNFELIVNFRPHSQNCQYYETNLTIANFIKNSPSIPSIRMNEFNDSNEVQSNVHYCATCNEPNKDFKTMIECSFCDKWYHCECQSMATSSKQEEWKCRKCVKYLSSEKADESFSEESSTTNNSEFIKKSLRKLNDLLQYIIDNPIDEKEKQLIKQNLEECKVKFEIVSNVLGIKNESFEVDDAFSMSPSKVRFVESLKEINEKIDNMNDYVLDVMSVFDKTKNENLI